MHYSCSVVETEKHGKNTPSLKISDKIELDERTQFVFEPKYATEW